MDRPPIGNVLTMALEAYRYLLEMKAMEVFIGHSIELRPGIVLHATIGGMRLLDRRGVHQLEVEWRYMGDHDIAIWLHETLNSWGVDMSGPYALIMFMQSYRSTVDQMPERKTFNYWRASSNKNRFIRIQFACSLTEAHNGGLLIVHFYELDQRGDRHITRDLQGTIYCELLQDAVSGYTRHHKRKK